MRSAMVEVGESGEGSLGFPGHVGIGAAETVFEHLRPGPQPRLSHLAHRQKESMLVLWGNGIYRIILTFGESSSIMWNETRI